MSCNIRSRSEWVGEAVVIVTMVSSSPLKELHGRKATSPPAKPEQYYATAPQATLPRSGFVLWSPAAGCPKGGKWDKAAAFKKYFRPRLFPIPGVRRFLLWLQTIAE